MALALLAQAAFAAPRVIAVDVDGMVHPITAEIVGSAIAQAKQENASLLLVRLNTPGGLMDAMREIIEKIVSSPVPVVTYVAPSGGRAASAGFFILESGDVAAMAPGTNTGAAHPVLMAGEMDAVMKQKVENDAAAYLRSICAKRGRNSALAETTVRESKSFTEREALDQHLIDLIAPNEQALLSALNGRVVTRFDGSTQTLRHRRGGDRGLPKVARASRSSAAIADPNIALVLLVIGALGMYVEFSSPGLIAPGVVGAILRVAGTFRAIRAAHQLAGRGPACCWPSPCSCWRPSSRRTGSGVGGAVAMVLGAVMLIDSPFPEMRIHWSTAIALALPFSAHHRFAAFAGVARAAR